MIRLVVRERLRGRRMNDGIFAMLMVFMTLLPQAATGAEVGQEPALSTDRGDLISPSMGREVRALVPGLEACEVPTLDKVVLTGKVATYLELEVAWSGSTLDATNCPSFLIERKVGTDDWEEWVCADTNSFHDGPDLLQDIMEGNKYTYRVNLASFDVSDCFGNKIANKVSNEVAIDPVTFLSAVVEGSQIDLSWSSITGAVSYKLERHDGTAWSQIGGTLTTNGYSDTGGAVGTDYKYRVHAVVLTVDKSWSNEVAITYPGTVVVACTGGTAATSLTATSEADGIALAWTGGGFGSGGCTKWVVERAEGSGAFTAVPGAEFTTESTRTYTDTSAVAGKSYAYQVTLDGSASPSPTANVSSYIVLTGTAGVNRNNLSWTSIPQASYALRYRPSSGTGAWSDQITSIPVATYVHRDGDPGETYEYQVRASGETWSNTVQVVFPQLTACSGGAKATSVSVTPRAADVYVEWHGGSFAAILNQNSTCDSWVVERKPLGSGTFESIDESTNEAIRNFADTEAEDGMSYEYRVTLTGGAHASDKATIDPFMILTATAGASDVALSWMAISGAAGYTAQYKTATVDWAPLTLTTPTSTSTTHTGGIADSEYTYRVRADTKDWSNEATATFPTPKVAPDMPTGLEVDPPDPDLSIYMRWIQGPLLAAKTVDTYQIEYGTASDFTAADTVDIPIANLRILAGTPNKYLYVFRETITPCTIYYFRLRAKNAAGKSDPSAAEIVTTPKAQGGPDCTGTKPDTVTGFTVTQGDPLPDATVNLSWIAPAGATIYRIESEDCEPGSEPWITESSTDATSYIDTEPCSGLAKYRVAGGNTAGYGDWVEGEVMIEELDPPDAPTMLEVEAQGTVAPLDSIFDFSWTKPAGGGTPEGYRLQSASSKTASFTAWVAGQITITGADNTMKTGVELPRDTTIYFRVVAFNSNSDTPTSPPSNIQTIIVPETPAGDRAPGPPQGLTAAPSGTNIVLAWSVPATTPNTPAITGYKIESSEDAGSTWTDLHTTATPVLTYRHAVGASGKTVHYRVSAINAVGAGVASSVVPATTEEGLPGPPTGLTATAGETDITLTWIKPAVEGASAIKYYKIESSVNGTTWLPLDSTSTPVLKYVHAAVPKGKLTYYRVRAVNTEGESEPSNVDQTIIGVGTASSKPRTLKATAATAGITLTWLVPATPGSTPTTSYRIERSVDAKATWQPLVRLGNVLTHLDTGVAAGVRAYYRVYAINQAGNSPASDIADATMVGTTKKKPTAPKNLSATAGTTDIALAWQAPADTGSSAIKNYRIERSANGTSGWSTLATVAGTATSHDDSSAKAGVARYYRVFAINDAGESSASATASATINARKPSMPRNLSTRLMADGVQLSWRAPSDAGSSEIDNYRVEWSSNGSSGWASLGTVNGTTFLHTEVAASTTIYYRVIAISSAGESPPSSTASATTGRDTPTAPRSLLAEAATGGISLTWQAPSDNGSSAIENYRIEQSPNGSSGWTVLGMVGGANTSYLHTGAAPSTTIHFRVIAINDTGDGPPSNTASITTGRDLPTAPRSLRVKAVRDGNQLTWREPADTGSTALTGYQIEESTDGGSTWAALTTPDAGAVGYLHRSPEPGTTTYYRIYAINASGEGPASNVVSMETPANPPTRPRSLSAYATGTVVRLAWNPPDNDGGAEVTGYRVEAARNLGGWGALVADTESTETSYTDKAEPGSTVSYRVSAINAAGRGPTSNVVRVEVEAVAPEAPGGVGALATGPTAIGIAWNPPTNNGGSPVTAYRIEYSTDGGFWNVLVSHFQATSTSYRHTKLKPATEYHYRVFAINKIGIGEASPVVTATTHADLPGIVERLTATAAGATHIDLSWIEPKYTGGVDIDAYEIETSDDGSTWRMLASMAGDESTYQHKGLEPATTYHYRVTARNEVGRGKTSRPVFAETKAALPGIPTDLAAKALSHEEIHLTWGTPANSGGARITGYFIEVSDDEGSSWTVLRRNTGTTNTVFTHKGLMRATIYSYRVAALNKVGAGEKSDVTSAKTFALVSSPPRYLEAEVESSTQIDLNWTAPEDDGGAEIMSYLIETSPDLEEWTRLADVDRGLEYSHTDVIPGQTYHYRASAKNEAGYSLMSNIVSAATDDPLERTERVISAILPRFAITAVNSSVRAITTRIDLVASDRKMANRINVRGGEQGFLGIANGSQGQRAIGGASVWGSADLAGLREQGTVDWDGQVFSVHAGVDGMLRDGILVGLAGSRSRGTFDFTDQMGARDVEGEFDASLTSMNPYVAWVKGDVGAWATTGFGWGEIEISNDGVGDRSSTLISSMVAVGGYREILSSPMGSFRIKAEGMSSSIEVAGNVPPHIGDGVDAEHINESTINLRRGRVMLDWTVPQKIYGEVSAELRFEGGMRYDYNDLETGINGAELGGGLRISGPIFRAQGNGRIFLHPDHREWGIQGLVELRSRQESGLSLQVSPTYGNAQSGLNQLWENGAAKSMTASTNSGQIGTVLEYRRTGWSPYSRMDYRGERTTVQTGVTYRLNGLDVKGAAAYREDKPGLSLQIRLVH